MVKLEQIVKMNAKGQITIPNDFIELIEQDKTLYFYYDETIKEKCTITTKSNPLSNIAIATSSIRSRNRLTIPVEVRSLLLKELSNEEVHIKLIFHKERKEIELWKMLSTSKRTELGLELFTIAKSLESYTHNLTHAANNEDVQFFYSSLKALIHEADRYAKKIDNLA